MSAAFHDRRLEQQREDPEFNADFERIFYMLTKQPPRIVGRVCQSETLVDRGDGVAARCKRPVWGDGRVDGEFYGYCSRCWHQYNAFHGHFTTMQANPAAAKLDVLGIQRLTFTERSHKMSEWNWPDPPGTFDDDPRREFHEDD